MHISITFNKCIGESSPVYLYCSKLQEIAKEGELIVKVL